MFNSSDSCLTMPVTPMYGGYGNGFGGEGSWIIWLVLILAIFGGWGNGWGGYGAGGVSENYTLISDMGQLERKIDGVYSGICDSTFALNNTITNGFASAQNTMTQGFAGLNTALVTQGYEGRIATQGVGNTVQNCCCDLRQQISDVNYNIATQANMIDRGIADGFCKTNYNNASNTRDVIDSQNAGTKAILDKLCQMEINAKDEKIADLQAKNFDLRLAASQEAQNNYLVSKLDPNPCPVSAYVVQPPQTVSFPIGCNGYANYTQNSGCGCGQTYGTTIA